MASSAASPGASGAGTGGQSGSEGIPLCNTTFLLPTTAFPGEYIHVHVLLLTVTGVAEEQLLLVSRYACKLIVCDLFVLSLSFDRKTGIDIPRQQLSSYMHHVPVSLQQQQQSPQHTLQMISAAKSDATQSIVTTISHNHNNNNNSSTGGQQKKGQRSNSGNNTSNNNSHNNNQHLQQQLQLQHPSLTSAGQIITQIAFPGQQQPQTHSTTTAVLQQQQQQQQQVLQQQHHQQQQQPQHQQTHILIPTSSVSHIRGGGSYTTSLTGGEFCSCSGHRNSD